MRWRSDLLQTHRFAWPMPYSVCIYIYSVPVFGTCIRYSSFHASLFQLLIIERSSSRVSLVHGFSCALMRRVRICWYTSQSVGFIYKIDRTRVSVNCLLQQPTHRLLLMFCVRNSKCAQLSKFVSTTQSVQLTAIACVAILWSKRWPGGTRGTPGCFPKSIFVVNAHITVSLATRVRCVGAWVRGASGAHVCLRKKS